MREKRTFSGFFVIVAALFVAAVSIIAAKTLNASPSADVPVAEVSSGFAETALAAGSAETQRQYRYVRCDSVSKRRNTCETFGKDPVKLWQRHSSAKCRKKKDWNSYDKGRFVWVQNGCRATFQVRER